METSRLIPIFVKIFYDVKIKEVVFALERFAPLPLQESYDNAGLQVGLTEVEASGALLCLDVTEEAIQNDVTVYAAHTNLDNAEDGVNFKIAEKLELEQVRLLLPHPVKVKDGGHEYTVMAGSGVIGVLPQPEDSLKFLQRIKSVFHIECLMHNELLQRPVRKVVLCGGAGDFMLEEALNQKADAFLTGEMHYHQYFGHDQELQIAVMGHYQSEQYTKEIFYSIIGEICPELPLYMTAVDTNPIKYL